MSHSDTHSEGELILYRTPEGTVTLEVLYEGETFWLDQKRIAELFGVDIRTISYHLREIYDSGELRRAGTLQKIWRVQTEGQRQVRRVIEATIEAHKQYWGTYDLYGIGEGCNEEGRRDALVVVRVPSETETLTALTHWMRARNRKEN